MKIHVIQREGTRYFNRFSNISERDRLQVELQIEDKNGQTISIDLTEALIEEYSKHPQIGRVSIPSQVVEIASLEPIKPLKAKRSKTVSPAYLSNSAHSDILSKVREAQVKAADEKKQKQAELAAARAERLAIAREAKAKKNGKLKVESGKSRTASTKAKAAPVKTSKAAAPKAKAATAKTAKVAAPKAKASKPATKTASSPPNKAAGVTKTQAQAIQKISKVLAKEEKGQLALVTSTKRTPKASAKAAALAPKSTKVSGGKQP